MKISPEVLQYLTKRGITDQSEKKRFLFPSLADHYDPFILNGMRQAVDLLKSSIKKNRHILIWGDADLDGISSTVLYSSAPTIAPP